MALASHGATVTLMARNEERLERVRDELPTPAGQRHRYLPVDFAVWTDVRDAAAEDVEANGPVSVLVNNTGGPAAGPIIDAEPESFAAAFEQHVLANQALVEVVRPGMITTRYGRIVNIISTSVVTPIRGLGVSNTIRGAVANWGRTLASELGPHGITVNNVLPGYIDTQRLATSLGRRAEAANKTLAEISEAIMASIPARRLGTPADIGEVVAFLASPAAAYVNGVNLPVDGGRLVALNR